MNNMVLVIIVNGDAICAYPIDKEDAKNINVIRSRVQQRVREEGFAPRDELPEVRCQLVSVDMPGCSPDGFIASLINDIMDKVST